MLFWGYCLPPLQDISLLMNIEKSKARDPIPRLTFIRFISLFLGNYKSVAACFSLIYNADIAVVCICEGKEIVAEKIHL